MKTHCLRMLKIGILIKMAVNNSTILAKAYLEGTSDYQQRIPDPTQSSISKTIDALFDPMNRNYYNQFSNFLIQRIGLVVVNGKSFNNPLKEFKGQKLNYGNTVEEIAPAWIKAHSYQDNAETLLKMYRPDLRVWFHSQNRRDFYPISVNQDELKSAFTDEYGLNNLINKITMLPQNSDEYDEFNIMKNLLALYHARWNMPSIQLDSLPRDKTSGEDFLTKVKTYAGLMEFPSTTFNNQKFKNIPVFAKPDELILIADVETLANVDVKTLASVFQLDKADLPYRIVKVDHIPIPNTPAILTTRDIWVQHDTVLNMTNFYNPETLGYTYYWHHWGVNSISPFVPIVRFTTDKVNGLDTITQSVSGLSITADTKSADLGDVVPLKIMLQGTISNTELSVSPRTAATFGIMLTPGSSDTDSEFSALNSRTFIDEYNNLHIQDSGLHKGDVLTIYATSPYVNPSGETVEAKGELQIGIGQAPVSNKIGA